MHVLWKPSPTEPACWTSDVDVGVVGGGWMIPGLVDVHCHLSIGESGIADTVEAQAAADAELRSGVTVIREPGTPVGVDPLESYQGPQPLVIRSGRHIARTRRYLPGLAVELEDQADLPRVVVEQAALADGWVKLIGDWIDRSGGIDSDLDPLWERSVLIDAVQAAHAVGARVAVHAFSRTVIDDLLVAGVDSIEHGSGMTRDHALEAVRLGIPVTPTLGQVELFASFAAAAGRKYPRYAATMQAMFDNRQQWFTDLIAAGVHLLPGTDAGGYQPHGDLGTELQRWVDYGLADSQAVDCATWRARDFLGLPSLQPEVPLDAVVYDSDPSADIGVLKMPLQVIVGGKSL